MPAYSGMWTLSQVAQAIKNQDWTGIPPTVVEYLIVAGGGSGGYTYGAGGGAGGLLQGFAGIAPGTSYFVTIGAGGASNGASTDGNTGSASVFDATGSGASTGRIIATGGGGAGGSSSTATAGKSGGSGGGAGGFGGLPGGAGISGQGNAGGASVSTSNYGSGGGGGAGTAGFPGTTTYGGNGGAGIASDITGTRVTYAGGGGGGLYETGSPGIGGAGGGASCPSTANVNGNPGQPNTGGGGSGNIMNGLVPGLTGGAGGSGIVVVRYPGNVQFFTGGTLNYSNGFMVHTFYSSGTLAPTTPRLFASPDYQISRSLRFNSADNTYLNRTFGTATSRQRWTLSFWTKRSGIGTGSYQIFASRPTGTPYALIYFNSNTFQMDDNGSCAFNTSQVFRDTSAWYHLIIAVDTTQQTNSDRLKVYVNGAQVTNFTSTTYPTQNYQTQFNTVSNHTVGRGGDYTSEGYDGYLTEINFIDGLQLTPASFGYTESSTGVWTPLQYTGSYGTNGFYLNFADNSNTTAATLGKDLSGNGNNFTPNNFSVTAGVNNDSLLDSPTNYGTDTGAGGEVRGNYATWNPIDKSPTATATSNGNLDVVLNTGTSPDDTNIVGTIAVSSGKWYWEVVWTADNGTIIGVWDTIVNGPSRNRTTSYFYGYLFGGNKYNSGTATAYGASYTYNDVIGIALDMDAGTLTFYKNGTSQGVAFSSLTGKTLIPILATTTGSTNAVLSATINFGQRPFAYTAPSGHKALCSQNLPESAIGKLPSNYFNVAKYIGNSGVNKVGLGFKPDMIWQKSRDASTNHVIDDSVRGINNVIITNSTLAELTGTTYITSLDYDGFTMNTNSQAFNSGGNYVAWGWVAGGPAVTNTSGSITSTVSASPAAGFSIVTYTGSGSNGTIGHGLGVAPSMIIQKNRTGYNWRVYHVSAGNTKELYLDLTTEATTASAAWSNTTPTTTVFSVGSGSAVNGGGFACVAYCFAEISGYSKFGSYTGNNSTDGPFVYCGFRPRYVMYKCSSTTGNWIIIDTARDLYNVSSTRLLSNTTDSETSGTHNIDILSNGFKLRNTDTNGNASAATYIFAAFAESPLKYSRGR